MVSDLITAGGLVATDGIGCLQLSDQQGNVIEVCEDDAMELLEWLDKRLAATAPETCVECGLKLEGHDDPNEFIQNRLGPEQ